MEGEFVLDDVGATIVVNGAWPLHATITAATNRAIAKRRTMRLTTRPWATTLRIYGGLSRPFPSVADEGPVVSVKLEATTGFEPVNRGFAVWALGSVDVR